MLGYVRAGERCGLLGCYLIKIINCVSISINEYSSILMCPDTQKLGLLWKCYV